MNLYDKICKKYFGIIEKVNDYFLRNISGGNENNKQIGKHLILDEDINSLNIHNDIDKNNSDLELIEYCVKFLKMIKLNFRSNDILIRNAFKIFFSFILEKLLPKNFVKLRNISKTEDSKADPDTKMKFYKTQDFFPEMKIEISLLIKIQNFQIFQFFNILLISTYFIISKDYEESLLLLSKTEEFIFNKNTSFNFSSMNRHSSIIYECDDVLQFIRYKLLNNYLSSLEKTKQVSKKISEIFKLYRKSTIEYDYRITVSLINFVIRQYILNKSYSQALNFMNKISFNVDDHIGIKEGIRLCYYSSLIFIVQGDFQTALNYSECALASITKIINRSYENEINFIPKLFTNILIIFLISQVTLMNINFISEYSLIKGLENIFIEYSSNCKKNSLFDMNTMKLIKKCISNKANDILPYLLIISCVTCGKIKSFQDFLSKYEKKYLRDGLYLVLSRLNRYAIIYGLIRLNRKYVGQTLSISAVLHELEIRNDLSFKDIYHKEKFIYIIAKNIKEKLINAKIIKKEEFNTAIDEYNYEISIKFKSYSIDFSHYINTLSSKKESFQLNIFNRQFVLSNNSSICLSTDDSINNSI